MEFFVPTVAGVPLCQAKLRIMARSRTPAICEATAQLLEDEDSNRESVVRIIGRDFGVCEVEVTYPEANGGSGTSRVFEVAVGKFPDLGADRTSTRVERDLPWWLAPLLALVVPLSLLPLVTWRLR